MSARAFAAALAAAAVLPLPTRAETPLPPIVLATEPSAAETAEDDGLEVALDWGAFVAHGYKPITWNGPPERRLDVLRKLVGPAYLARTGKEADDDAPFDFDLLNVTGGDFNDIVVSSRLPGDCGETGCRVMVFSTQDGNGWSKVADFTAMGVAFRRGGAGQRPSLAAVGDEVSPSFTLEWNGLAFLE